MRFNIKRCLIILLACIFIPLSVLSAGYSNWYVLQQSSKTAQGNKINGDTLDSIIDADTVNNAYGNVLRTVYYYHWLTSSTTNTSTENGSSAQTAANRSGNFITGYTYSVSNTAATFTVTSPNGLFNGVTYNFNSIAKGNTPTTITRSNADGTLTEKLIFSQKFSSSWGSHTYTVSWSFEITTVTLTEKFDSTIDTKKVADGSYIPKPDFSNHTLASTYTLIGFYEYTDNGPTTEFDFSANTITADKKIIAQWSDKDETSGASGNSLTSRVASLTSGNELKVYSGTTASGTYDYTSDYTYAAKGKSLNLGYLGATAPTTIASNATLSLSMDGMNGAYHQEAELNNTISNTESSAKAPIGTDKFVSVDYTSTSNVVNPRDYTVRLQNDLVINGKLNIGGYTGSAGGDNNAPQGMIIGNYVKLDLNGHTITVASGGTLQSFGYITDSVGTGKIIVEPNGQLLTQIVIVTLKGGNNTIWSYGKGICPFEDYFFPYVDTTVEVLSEQKADGTATSGAGSLIGFTKLNLGSLGFINLHMPLVGNSATKYNDNTSPYLFGISGKGKFTLSNSEISALKTNTTFLKQYYYLKNIFTFENLTVDFNAPFFKMDLTVSITSISDAPLDLQRIIFPLSSLLDINFINSNFYLDQKIQILPGSSITFDKNSTLIFNYYTNNGALAKKKFDKISKTILGIGVTLCEEQKYLSGGILTTPPEFITTSQYTGNPYGLYSSTYNTYYKNTFKGGAVNIYGNVQFTSGNSSEAPYTLAGNINASTFSIDNGEKQAFNLENLQSLYNSTVSMRTYDLNIHSGNFYWFGGVSDITNGNDNSAYSAAIHFYALPATVNGISYLFNTDKSIAETGSFGYDSGIFTTADKTKNYFFLTNNSLLTTSSSGGNTTVSPSANQDYSIDYKITPTACTLGNNLTITYNSSSYVYFGGLYFPITATTSSTQVTANLQKFHSRTDYSAKTLTYQSAAGYWKLS